MYCAFQVQPDRPMTIRAVFEPSGAVPTPKGPSRPGFVLGRRPMGRENGLTLDEWLFLCSSSPRRLWNVDWAPDTDKVDEARRQASAGGILNSALEELSFDACGVSAARLTRGSSLPWSLRRAAGNAAAQGRFHFLGHRSDDGLTPHLNNKPRGPLSLCVSTRSNRYIRASSRALICVPRTTTIPESAEWKTASSRTAADGDWPPWTRPRKTQLRLVRLRPRRRRRFRAKRRPRNAFETLPPTTELRIGSSRRAVAKPSKSDWLYVVLADNNHPDQNCWCQSIVGARCQSTSSSGHRSPAPLEACGHRRKHFSA